jgi:hypothetical protein
MSLQERVDEALRDAFTQEQDSDSRAGIVTAWALTCEVVGVDGEVWLHTMRSRGLTAWQALGMVEAHAGDLRAFLTTPGGAP